MFTRTFGVFSFLGECGRCPAPKRRALPTAPHPDVWFLFDFGSISVSGQICGQTTKNGIFMREDSAEKVSVCKGFRRFLLRDTLGAVSCSQTRRATNCATSRKVKILNFCKWSNLWSRRFFETVSELGKITESQCLQGFLTVSLSVEPVVGNLLPNQARYHLRYIPKNRFWRCFEQKLPQTIGVLSTPPHYYNRFYRKSQQILLKK